jgi:hypothetical protein
MEITDTKINSKGTGVLESPDIDMRFLCMKYLKKQNNMELKTGIHQYKNLSVYEEKETQTQKCLRKKNEIL